jgi:hypothetical protein
LLKSKVFSVSGRTVTPFLASRNAPTFTKKAKDDPSATDGNASSGAITCWTLVGRIQAREIEELRDQMDGRTRATILDLQEVTLVDVEVVRFLGRCEANGVELARCSPYIREWVFREQAAGEGN